MPFAFIYQSNSIFTSHATSFESARCHKFSPLHVSEALEWVLGFACSLHIQCTSARGGKDTERDYVLLKEKSVSQGAMVIHLIPLYLSVPQDTWKYIVFEITRSF